MPTLMNPNSAILSTAEGGSSYLSSAFSLAALISSPRASHGFHRISDCAGKMQVPSPGLVAKHTPLPVASLEPLGTSFNSPFPLNIHGCLDATVEG